MPFWPWAMTSTPPAESRRYLSSSRASRSSSTISAVIGMLSEPLVPIISIGSGRKAGQCGSSSGLEGTEAGGHVIRSETVAAVDTVDVRDTHATVAITASRGYLVGAL